MRPPDLTIGSPPQTLRWHLFRGSGRVATWLRQRGIQVALHRWNLSDSDRALHDHSADNWSVLLTGWYWEWFSHAWEAKRRRLRLPLIPYFRRAETPHRVQLGSGPMWTLWIRFKPRREWGFWCEQGWRHWKEYVAERGDYNALGRSTVGRGCG